MSLPILENDPIRHGEFYLINEIGEEITHLIKNPKSNGLYSPENPLLEELLEIIKTVEGQAPVSFKQASLQTRMLDLYNIVSHSKGSPDVLRRLKHIHKVALAHLSDKNPGKNIDIEEEFLVQTKSMLPAFPSKKRTTRSQDDIDGLIRILWGGIAVLYSFPEMNDDRKLEIFKLNFQVLINGIGQDSDSFSFEVLEKIFILKKFVENIFRKKGEELQKKQTRTKSNRKISARSTSASSSSSVSNRPVVVSTKTLQKDPLSHTSQESSDPAPLLPKENPVIVTNMAPIKPSQKEIEAAQILSSFSEISGGQKDSETLIVVSKKRKNNPVKVPKISRKNLKNR